MGSSPAPDFERLEEYFHALAYSARLEILHALRFPKTLPDIKVAPKQVRPGENPERAISRQALAEHVAKLVDIGVVVADEPDGARGPKTFVVSGPKLYQIMEEFRQIGTVLSASPTPADDGTVEAEGARDRPLAPGPKLVLVHGLLEGRPFALDAGARAAGRGWVVGRKRGLAVSLEYDPFVSNENSEIVADGDSFAIEDLASSRNGTWVNWRRLKDGERARLEPGDVVGVGRSLLVFRQR